MTITNLTNTTWVFKDGPLDFSGLKRGVKPLNFSCDYWTEELHAFWYDYSGSNSTHYIKYVYVMPQSAQVYTQNDSTGVFAWGKPDYQTIQITGGLAVTHEDFINFLSKNAICQTPLVTVTFNTNGIGASVSSQTFASGGKVIMSTPSAEGYIFAGWYTDSGLTTAFDFSTSVTSNITLYAKWIPKAIKTKVSGAWNSGTPLVKVNNTWKDVDKAFVKVNGVWQSVINNVPPSPVVSTFKIENITYTFEEGMTWNDWVLSSKYSKSTSGMNIPSSPTSAGFHGELSSSVEITDNSEAYKSGAGYVCVGWGDSKEEAYWDLLVYTPDIYSLIRKVRSWEIIFPNQEYFIKWA